MSGWGARVVFDTMGYGDETHTLGRSIYLLDLESGAVEPIATAAGGDAAWTPRISGDYVAWVEWHYADNTVLRGALTWRIVAMDLRDRHSWTVASAVNTRLEGGAGVPPALDVSGSQIAYAVESPTPDRPWGWTILVRTLPSNELVRRIETAEDLYALALSDGAVAYSEGLVDTQLSFKYKTRLMVSTVAQPSPRRVAADAFELAMDGPRLAWVDDRAASQGGIGLAQYPRIYSTLLGDPSPEPLSAPPDGVSVRSSSWPSAGDGLVAWSDNQDTPARGQPVGAHLVVWSAATGRATQLEPTAGMILSAVGQGWLVWYDDRGLPDTYFAGLPIGLTGLR